MLLSPPVIAKLRYAICAVYATKSASVVMGVDVNEPGGCNANIGVLSRPKSYAIANSKCDKLLFWVSAYTSNRNVASKNPLTHITCSAAMEYRYERGVGDSGMVGDSIFRVFIAAPPSILGDCVQAYLALYVI
jgi:hypothetical protein